MQFKQTDQYDPNPEPQITTRELHLTASTPNKAKTVEFVTLYRPHRSKQAVPQRAELKSVPGGYVLTAELSAGRVVVLLPSNDTETLTAEKLTTQGKVLVQRYRADGDEAEKLLVKQLHVVQ